MNNYHSKQKEKNSFKSSIKKFNAIFEIDTNIGSAYFYIPPNTAKNPIKVEYSQHIESFDNTYLVDFDKNEHIIGFEIIEANKHIDLQGLGIQEIKGINRGEIDGNRI